MLDVVVDAREKAAVVQLLVEPDRLPAAASVDEALAQVASALRSRS
jgi:hypothetical protein